jgi:hypothetical protein
MTFSSSRLFAPAGWGELKNAMSTRPVQGGVRTTDHDGQQDPVQALTALLIEKELIARGAHQHDLPQKMRM